MVFSFRETCSTCWAVAGAPARLQNVVRKAPLCSRRPRAAYGTRAPVAEMRLPEDDPPFIPQTIEYALSCAQEATAAALVEGHTRLIVSLPMGRSRKHWYRLSPMDSDLVLTESATLAVLFAELFKGARVHVVLGVDRKPEREVQWIESLTWLGEKEGAGLESGDRTGVPDVVVIAAMSVGQKKDMAKYVESISERTTVVLFNCMLDCPIAPSPFASEYRPAYICRSSNKTAVLYIAHGPDAEGWHIYTETAIFEYEWVGCVTDAEWEPVAAAVEYVIQRRGATRRTLNGYWQSAERGCESGFWPFMTVASQTVLPLPGSLFVRKEKPARNNSRPFGFF